MIFNIFIVLYNHLCYIIILFLLKLLLLKTQYFYAFVVYSDFLIYLHSLYFQIFGVLVNRAFREGNPSSPSHHSTGDPALPAHLHEQPLPVTLFLWMTML